MTTENIIRCKEYALAGDFGGYCKLSNCIYNPKYHTKGEINGCNVNGHVNPNDISKNLRNTLTAEDLKTNIEIRIIA